jgi:hypothetical protein
MARRHDFDWRREWIEEQIEAETQEERVPFWWRPAVLKDDWSFIPVHSARNDPPPGRTRLYVVQTCRWRDDWEEFARWSAHDGRALAAFDDFVGAKWYASREQVERGERLGMIEIDVAGALGEEVFLLKDSDARHQWNPEYEGRILAGFADRFSAEQDALRRDRDDWRSICDRPCVFRLKWSSLPTTILGDLFLDLGVTAPPWEGDYPALLDWWKQTAPLMDGWQRERLRQAMDRFSDYRVVAVPLEW